MNVSTTDEMQASLSSSMSHPAPAVIAEEEEEEEEEVCILLGPSGDAPVRVVHEEAKCAVESVDHSIHQTCQPPHRPLAPPPWRISEPNGEAFLGRIRQRSCSSSSAAAVISTERQTILWTPGRSIYTGGKPSWFDPQTGGPKAFVIGIAGGSASGKTTVAQKIIEKLELAWVTLLSMDSFYKVLDEKEHELALKNEYDFDHPDSFDWDLMIDTLRKLSAGLKVDVPIYNFVTHKREQKTVPMCGANFLIFEGILAFHRKEVLDMLDMKVFVDADSDIRLCRRLRRDIAERGRALRGIIEQYKRFVKPAFSNYVLPSMLHADIIVPMGRENEVAINLIVRQMNTQRGLRKEFRRELLQQSPGADQPLPISLKVLPSTVQIAGMHTFLRDAQTPRDEFIFFSKRLIRLVIEYALSLLPYEPVTVMTPQGIDYVGKKSSVKNICGVSILRETMEEALSEVCQDVNIGKILIQTSDKTGEATLHRYWLPRDIRSCHVILMDATVATGAAVMTAIRVLLDQQVKEENICVTSLLMAKPGIQNIAYAYPNVNLVTTAVDPGYEKAQVMPGFGNFGDRYFGTEVLDILHHT